MAGLYLIGFTAPAFEAAACHVGETIDPNRNVPRAMLASAIMAGVYFIVLPVVWLGVLGPEALGNDLASVLGPTFAPLLGSLGKSAAIWFVMLNMFHGTLQPLAGAARTMSQLADDGLLPRFLSRRLAKTDCPWAATLLTAGLAIIFLMAGDPVWMIAAANFTYLIGICMPNIAAWLLRRDLPDAVRPYRAPRGMVTARRGRRRNMAAGGHSRVPAVRPSDGLIRPGTGLLGGRPLRMAGHRGSVRAGPARFCQDAARQTYRRYAVRAAVGRHRLSLGCRYGCGEHSVLVAVLADIFVAVALLTISVGLVLPGMITYSATEVSKASKRLTSGTLRQFSQAMGALGRGDLDAAHASVNIVRVKPNSRDELGEMAENFNVLQEEVRVAALGLGEARENMRTARAELLARHEEIAHRALHDL